MHSKNRKENPKVNKGVYHVTTKGLLPVLMRMGVRPMCGPSAYAQGQEVRSINVYTTREAVRDALAPSGDYMVTHEGVKVEDLCVLNIMVPDLDQKVIDRFCKDSCSILRVVRPGEFIVLDTNLRQISSVELAELSAG